MLETARRPPRSVKSEESIFGARAVEQSWKRPSNDPIPLPRGGQLVTLEGRRQLHHKLPKAVHEVPEDDARIGVMRALNRNVERVKPSRVARSAILCKSATPADALDGNSRRPNRVRPESRRKRHPADQ